MDTPSGFLNPQDSAKLTSVLQQLTDFIARYETIEQQLEGREEALQALLLKNESDIQSYLARIREMLDQYESVMSETGAARFRVNAETILKEGEAHLEQIKQVSTAIIENIKTESAALSEVAKNAGRHFQETLKELHPEILKENAEKSYFLLEEMGTEVVKRVTKTFRGFFLKNLFSVGVVTLFVVAFFGQYINGEWPWDTHARVIQEREVGNDLLEQWATMDPTVKKYLQEQVFTHAQILEHEKSI